MLRAARSLARSGVPAFAPAPAPVAAGPAPVAADAAAGRVVTLDLFRFDLSRLPWQIAQMGAGHIPLMRHPDVTFYKLLGCGAGAGFDARPDFRRFAILCAWPDAGTASGRSVLHERWGRAARERLSLTLAPTSVRGAWAGAPPFAGTARPDGGPVVSLTRARIRPRGFRGFWSRVHAISDDVAADPAVHLHVGVGEVPWIYQVTLSIWPDTAAMDRFARGSTRHARAIRAVRTGGWFGEELYARFNLIACEGTWRGRAPLPSNPEAP